jgi:glycosyltransferase involved in cell wall biosynthesis
VAQGPPARGGISTFASTLVQHPTLAQSFVMEMLNTTRQAERHAGTWSRTNAWNAVADAARTWRAARRADVVHVQTALMPTLPLVRALALCAAGRAGSAAVLCHVHSGRVNSGQRAAFSPTQLQRALLRRLAVADAVLTVSRPGAEALQELLPRTRVEPVDNAVDTTMFSPARLDGEPPTLIYVGTLSERKGLADLMEALRLLAERGGPAYRLQVIGGSAEVGEVESERLRQAVRAGGHADALLGSRSGPEVQQHLQEADVFVLPSHWEGQPIAILEAMATGLPVVVTSVGANPDVVRDGVDGRVVPPRDPGALAEALSEVLGNAELRRRMGAAGRERAVQRHDTRLLGERMAQVYHDVIGRRRA